MSKNFLSSLLTALAVRPEPLVGDSPPGEAVSWIFSIPSSVPDVFPEDPLEGETAVL